MNKAWHIDNLKISHVDQTVVDDVTKNTREKYTPMKTQRDKALHCSGMTLDFSEKSKIYLKIDKCAQKYKKIIRRI